MEAGQQASGILTKISGFAKMKFATKEHPPLKKALEFAKIFDQGHGRCEEYECSGTMALTVAKREIKKIECKS